MSKQQRNRRWKLKSRQDLSVLILSKIVKLLTANTTLMQSSDTSKTFSGRDFFWVRETWPTQDKHPWLSTVKNHMSQTGSGTAAEKRYMLDLHIQIG